MIAELTAAGVDAPYEQVLLEVEERDQGDASRAIAPLKPAADTRIVDSTHLDADGVLMLVLEDLRTVGIHPNQGPNG